MYILYASKYYTVRYEAHKHAASLVYQTTSNKKNNIMEEQKMH